MNNESDSKERKDYFSEESLKVWVVEKVVRLEDYNMLFDIYRYVRRKLQ